MRSIRSAALTAAILLAAAAPAVQAETPQTSPDAAIIAQVGDREEAFQERLTRLRALRRIAFEQQDEKRVAELDRIEVRLRTLRDGDHRRLRGQLSPGGRRALTGSLQMAAPDARSGRRRAAKKRTPPGALGIVAASDGTSERRPVKKRTRLDAGATGPSFTPPAGTKPDRRPMGPKRRPPSAGADASMTGSASRRTRTSAAITPSNAEAEFARLRAEIKQRR